jgi:hypothetical protein
MLVFLDDLATVLYWAGMHCHPATSGNSHLLEGVFLGVSKPNRNQKLHQLQDFYA